MKINMNLPLVGLDGKEIPETNMGKLVAQVLSETSKGDAIKLWFWAQKLYSGEALELDPTDTSALKNLIAESERLTILSKAQALACFEK